MFTNQCYLLKRVPIEQKHVYEVVIFEVVCNLLLVPHRSSSQVVECIHMFEYPHRFN
jgi:hypothetical protein